MTTQADQKDTTRRSRRQSFGGNGVVGVDMSTGVYGHSGATNGFALTRDGVRGFTDSSAASGVRGQNANGVNGVSGVTISSGSLGPRRSMAPTPAAGRECAAPPGCWLRGCIWIGMSRSVGAEPGVWPGRGCCAWDGGSGCVFCCWQVRITA